MNEKKNIKQMTDEFQNLFLAIQQGPWYVITHFTLIRQYAVHALQAFDFYIKVYNASVDVVIDAIKSKKDKQPVIAKLMEAIHVSVEEQTDEELPPSG